MPTPLVASLAKEAGLSIEEAEKEWSNAKKDAKDSGLTEENGNKYWKTVTAIFKNRIGLSKTEAAINRAEQILVRIDEAGVSSRFWSELQKYGISKDEVVKPLIDYIEGRLFRDEALGELAILLGQEKALLIGQILAKFGK